MENKRKVFYLVHHYEPNIDTHIAHVHDFLEDYSKVSQAEVWLLSETGSYNRATETLNVKSFGSNTVLRYFRLFKFLLHNVENGSVLFSRITSKGMIVMSIINCFKGSSSVYWLSGTTLEHGFKDRFFIRAWKFIVSKIPMILALKLTDTFVTGPESMADYYIKHYSFLKDKTKLLYNDIPYDKIAKRKEYMRSENSQGITEIKLLIVKRLSPIKNVSSYLKHLFDFLEMTKLDWSLDIYGEGADAINIHALVEEYNLASVVSLKGSLSNETILNCYRDYDIFLNLTDEEGFPRVLLEAMCAGLPILSTDAGGVNDIMPSSAKKFIFEVGDFQDMKKKLNDLLQIEDWESIGRDNRERSKVYSRQNVLLMFNNIING